MIILDTYMSSKSGKYYIEFVGQHTAGKTKTIHEIVDNNLLFPNTAIYPQKIKRSRLHFYFYLSIIFIKNINNFLFVLLYLLVNTKWSWINYHSSDRHLIKMVLLHPYYSGLKGFDTWMKDDMLHLLPRLEFKKDLNVKDKLEKFFDKFSYLYDGIVYIDLPYEVMRQRFEDRFQNRDKNRKENRGPVYERAFKQNIILKDIICNQNKIPYLIIDGTQNISENADKVVKFIKSNIYEK